MAHQVKSYIMIIGVGILLAACSNGQDSRHLRYQQNASAGYQGGNYTYNSAAPYKPHQGQSFSQPYHMQPGLAYNVDGHNGQMRQSYYPQQRGYGQRQGQPFPHLRGPYKGSKMSYENLNAFEAPVATEIAGVTFELRGRLDSVTDYSFDQDRNADHRLVGTHRLTAEKQLPNRLTIGAAFTGRHEDIGNSNADYKGRIRGYVGGSWGTVLGGNVQDIVYEDTRRLRGAGALVGRGPREENLWGDGALGRLNDWGGGYQGRFGPTTVSAIVDEDTNYDVGIKFQRPIGNKDYRLTARHNSGTYLAADGLTEIDTKAVTGVGEYVYGSTRYDISGGYEQLDTGATNADRWFTSAGVTTKLGLWNFTAEGHYGQIEGQDEVSAFAGVKYDIARGLSATAAVDYQDRQINVGGVDLVNEKDTRALMGLSYGF